jgi:hypothetical protein
MEQPWRFRSVEWWGHRRIQLQPPGHDLGLAHQGDCFAVERQAVKARTMLTDKGLQSIQRPFPIKDRGVALQGVGRIEDARATTAGFLA